MPMDDPIIGVGFPPDRSELTDQLYGVLGRAMALALRYEQNVRALAWSLGVRGLADSKMYGDEVTVGDLTTLIFKNSLARNIRVVPSGPSGEGVLKDKMFKAKDARNRIVHDLAWFDFDADHDLADVRDHMDELATAAKTVAAAEGLVVEVLNALQRDPTRSLEWITEDYPDLVRKWVFDPDSDLEDWELA